MTQMYNHDENFGVQGSSAVWDDQDIGVSGLIEQALSHQPKSTTHIYLAIPIWKKSLNLAKANMFLGL